MVSTDTSRESAEIVAEIYRNMPASEKIQRLFRAYQMGRQLAMAGLRERFPDTDETRLWHRWAQQHLGKQLYEQVYGEAADE